MVVVISDDNLFHQLLHLISRFFARDPTPVCKRKVGENSPALPSSNFSAFLRIPESVSRKNFSMWETYIIWLFNQLFSRLFGSVFSATAVRRVFVIAALSVGCSWSFVSGFPSGAYHLPPGATLTVRTIIYTTSFMGIISYFFVSPIHPFIKSHKRKNYTLLNNWIFLILFMVKVA